MRGNMRGNNSFTNIGKLKLFKPTISCFPNVGIKLYSSLDVETRGLPARQFMSRTSKFFMARPLSLYSIKEFYEDPGPTDPPPMNTCI